MVNYYIFFLLIALDSFFARNIIQMTVVFFTIILMYLWSYENKYKNEINMLAVVWIQRIYILQFALIKINQLPYIKTYYQNNLKERNILFVIGLILNTSPMYEAVAHAFLVGGILCFGQLYQTSFENYRSYIEEKSGAMLSSGLKHATKKLLKDSVNPLGALFEKTNKMKQAGIGQRQNTN
jgi:hypothetical protein